MEPDLPDLSLSLSLSLSPPSCCGQGRQGVLTSPVLWGCVWDLHLRAQWQRFLPSLQQLWFGLVWHLGYLFSLQQIGCLYYFFSFFFINKILLNIDLVCISLCCHDFAARVMTNLKQRLIILKLAHADMM